LSPVGIVTVYDPPVITTQPGTALAILGQSATLSAIATGRGPLLYQWYKGTAQTLIPGATNATYTIINVSTNDANQYNVKISNSDYWLISQWGYITIAKPPTIIGGVYNNSVAVGTNTYMGASCNGTGPLAYQWYKDGYLLPSGTNQTYSVLGATIDDQGNYQVVVSSPYGSATSTNGYLTVLYPPVISENPVSQNINQGTTTSIEVAAGGKQPMSYLWFKNGARIIPTSRVLTFVNIQPSDAGSYYAMITNSDGLAYTTTSVITVKPLPTISQQPTTTILTISNKLSLTVLASSSYTLTYQWYANGTAIPGATGSTFTITNVTFANSATYTVAVINQVGSIMSDPAIVIVLPIQPLKIQLNQIQPAILQFTAIGNGQMGFLYYGAVGRTYVIEAATNMVDWANIETNIPTTTINQFIDVNAAQYNNRFYRVQITQ